MNIDVLLYDGCDELDALGPYETFALAAANGAEMELRLVTLAPGTAVTHHGAIEDLRATGADVIADARVVDDADILTAAGVTSGIDLALWIVERTLDAEAANAIAETLEYRRTASVWRSRESRATTRD
jgi:putative intracellular protease/amidase